MEGIKACFLGGQIAGNRLTRPFSKLLREQAVFKVSSAMIDNSELFDCDINVFVVGNAIQRTNVFLVKHNVFEKRLKFTARWMERMVGNM